MNILSELVIYLQAVAHAFQPHLTATHRLMPIATQLVEVLEEAVQGPCHVTQLCLAFKTELLDDTHFLRGVMAGFLDSLQGAPAKN